MIKRTYQPNRLKRKRTHGFLRRDTPRASRAAPPHPLHQPSRRNPSTWRSPRPRGTSPRPSTWQAAQDAGRAEGPRQTSQEGAVEGGGHMSAAQRVVVARAGRTLAARG